MTEKTLGELRHEAEVTFMNIVYEYDLRKSTLIREVKNGMLEISILSDVYERMLVFRIDLVWHDPQPDLSFYSENEPLLITFGQIDEEIVRLFLGRLGLRRVNGN